MSRTREIKPVFFIDEELAEVSRDARLLFIGLWCLADCEGRMEDRPARIKTLTYPYDEDMPASRVDHLLDELANAPGDFVRRYEVDGKRYLWVRTLKKNQHFHPKERPAGFPPPPAARIPGKPGMFPASPALPSEPSGISEPSEYSSEVADEPTEPALLTFPCARSETWDLTESVRAGLAEAYPAIDVMACARRALEWCRANPKKIKTRSHMRGWIGSVWCGKEQDRPHQEKAQEFHWPRA